MKHLLVQPKGFYHRTIIPRTSVNSRRKPGIGLYFLWSCYENQSILLQNKSWWKLRKLGHCSTVAIHHFLFLCLDTLPPGGDKANALKILKKYIFSFYFSHSLTYFFLKLCQPFFLQCTSYEHFSIKSLLAVSSAGFPLRQVFAQCVLRQPLPSLLDPNKQVRKERNAVTWVGGAWRGWATLCLRNNMRKDRT